jgi:flagellar biosynthesis protein
VSESEDQPRDRTAKRLKAVALENDRRRPDLPRVVATGQGALAEQILAVAFANGVRVREDADLAELLGAVDVDSPIPLAALAAVAEILVYVYRANERLDVAGFVYTPPPEARP